MTPTEIETLLVNVATTREGAQAAIVQLVDAGHTPADAEEWVLAALGGGDIIETNADGIEVYLESQKPVAEVQAELAR